MFGAQGIHIFDKYLIKRVEPNPTFVQHKRIV